MLWKYKGLTFPNKKELRTHFQLSTCKFDCKVKDGEIIKLTNNQQATAYENKDIIC